MTSCVQRSLAVSSLAIALMCLTACGNGGDATLRGQPAGYAYVASVAAPDESMSGAVLQYAIGTDGSLTSSNTGSVPAGPSPVAIVSDPAGHYVYVANQGDGTISQYAIRAGGGLAALSPATVSVTGAPPFAGYALSMSPTGHALYAVIDLHDPPSLVANALIAQFAVGNDGTLSPLAPALLTVGGAVGIGPLIVDPSGTYAYLAGTAVMSDAQTVGGTVWQFSVGGDGRLTPMPSQTVGAARYAVGLALSPGGRTAYILSACTDNTCDGEIAEYTVGTNGMLTPTGATIATGSRVMPMSLVPDTSGTSAYLLTNLMGVDTNAGAVYQYSIDSTGALLAATPPSLDLSSGAVAQVVFGPNLYALSSNEVGFASGAPTGGHIDNYNIGTKGLLSTAGTASVSSGHPTAMTVVAAH